MELTNRTSNLFLMDGNVNAVEELKAPKIKNRLPRIKTHNSLPIIDLRFAESTEGLIA